MVEIYLVVLLFMYIGLKCHINYIVLYINTCRYTSMAFQSAVKQIYINYLLMVYVAPIVASKKHLVFMWSMGILS